MTIEDIADRCCDEVSILLSCEDVKSEGEITVEEVKCAQQEWCQGVLAISRAYQKNDPNSDRYASEFVDQFYDFGPGGRVFFRPTLAKFPNNFRTTKEGTLAYFIGRNPGDGFARKNFISAVFTNRVEEDGGTAIRIFGDTAIAMGNVCVCEAPNKEKTVVDKIFVYRKVGKDLKLMVHMSAVRNDPNKPAFE
jgi:hypothetical protein